MNPPVSPRVHLPGPESSSVSPSPPSESSPVSSAPAAEPAALESSSPAAPLLSETSAASWRGKTGSKRSQKSPVFPQKSQPGTHPCGCRRLRRARRRGICPPCGARRGRRVWAPCTGCTRCATRSSCSRTPCGVVVTSQAPPPPPFPVRPSNFPSSSQVKDGLTGWGTSSRRRAAGRRRRWGSRRGCRRPSRCCRRRSPRDPWDLRRKTRFGVKKGRFGSAWRFFRERGGWTRAHLPGRGRPGRLRRRG